MRGLLRRALRWRARCRPADVTLKAPVTQRDDWTLATVRAAAEPIAAAHGPVVCAFMVSGSRPIEMRIELLRGDILTCWIELPAADLDAARLLLGGTRS